MRKTKDNEDAPSRRTSKCIRVWVTPDEKAVIDQAAQAVGLSTSAYQRRLGLSLPLPPAGVDLDAVKDLLKINADLARLGNVLKAWVFSSDKLNNRITEARIQGLLDNIEALRAVMVDTASRL